ncbi:hypothetical protein [Acinetobacter pittii]
MDALHKNFEYLIARLYALNEVNFITLNENNAHLELLTPYPYEWSFEILPKLNQTYELLKNFFIFISDETVVELSSHIKRLLEIVDKLILIVHQFNEKKENEFKDQFNELKKTITALIKIPLFFKEIDNSTLDSDKEKIFFHILKSLNFNTDFYIRNFYKLNDLNRTVLVNKFIFAQNKVTDGTYTPQILEEINQFLLEITQKIISEKEKLLIEKEKKLREKEKQTIIRIESAKNESTIIEFKKKADDLKVYIYLLNGLIAALFISIILIFLQKYFSHPKETISFLYSAALVIAISSFMAFLIKEKNILSGQYHNYIKCHTEMVALATYVVDIDKVKTEDLKIRLAEKYFTGYLPDSKEANSNSLSNNDSINQIITLLKEIQKK